MGEHRRDDFVPPVLSKKTYLLMEQEQCPLWNCSDHYLQLQIVDVSLHLLLCPLARDGMCIPNSSPALQECMNGD